MIDVAVILDALQDTDFDPEAATYLLLAKLQAAEEKFQKKRLYPELAHLIESSRRLQAIKKDRERKRAALEKQERAVDIDWSKGILEYEPISGRPFEERAADFNRDNPDLNDTQKTESVFWMIDKMLDNLPPVIQLGAEIHDTVAEGIEFHTVGIEPSYKREGYIFIPNTHRQQLVIKRYTFTSLSQAKELNAEVVPDDNETRYVLKTKQITTIDKTPDMPTLSSIKTNLAQERPDLPNPATFYCTTDAEVPFADTLLPVVKRKFMGFLKQGF